MLDTKDLREIARVVDEVVDVKLKKELKPIKEDIKELKQDVSELKQDVSGLKQDVSGLKQDVSGLKKDVSNLDKRVSKLEMDNEQVIKPTLTLLREVYVPAANKFTTAAEQISDMQEDIKTLKLVTKKLSQQMEMHSA